MNRLATNVSQALRSDSPAVGCRARPLLPLQTDSMAAFTISPVRATLRDRDTVRPVPSLAGVPGPSTTRSFVSNDLEPVDEAPFAPSSLLNDAGLIVSRRVDEPVQAVA